MYLLDDFARSEIEVLPDNLCELSLALIRGTIVHHSDGQRFSDSDSVGHLNQAPSAQTGLYQGLGYPTGGVGCAAIDFGIILA